MCGQYYIAEEDRQAFYATMAEVLKKAEAMRQSAVVSGVVRPTNTAGALATNARNRSIGAFPMRWGFKHPQKGFLIINTRAETAQSKALFERSTRERRCLLPASGYYEWKTENGVKRKYCFQGEEKGPLYLAGLYLWTPEMQLPCFSILTREAPPPLAKIHERMPVILPEAAAKRWLSPDGVYAALLREAREDIAYFAQDA